MKQYLNRLFFKVGFLAYLGMSKLEVSAVNYLSSGRHVYCPAEATWWNVVIASWLV